MRGRPLLLLAAISLTLVASAQGSPPLQLKSPAVADISRARVNITDTVLPSVRRLERAGQSFWGGPITASTGETVIVYVSDAYAQDPAVAQRWADFLAGLLHGRELSSLQAYLSPLSEVQRTCGMQALACYDPSRSVLVAPGDDPSSDLSAEAVVTHEYGHHVAAHRSNLPWNAVENGTKRWATYEQVCARTNAGELFPGAETQPEYRLNPGEAFAETYRVLNERKAGLVEPPWQVVSETLYPDDTALQLVEQDVSAPWQGSTLTTRKSTLTKTVHTRTYSTGTPLDGTLRVTLRAPAGARYALAILSTSGAPVAAGTAGKQPASLSATVCGERDFKIRVTRVSGTGAFRLTTSVP